MAESGNETDEADPVNVASLAREVEEFVAAAGWGRPPQLFALVPTAQLLTQQPDLAEQLDPASALTPVAQEELPEGDLAEALGSIAWPDTVHGCALSQEIIVLPPDAEPELPGVDEAPAAVAPSDVERLKQAAADHPRRTEARLVAAVLRDDAAACVMRLRGIRTAPEDDSEPTDEIIEHPELAPNLVDALRTTLLPD